MKSNQIAHYSDTMAKGDIAEEQMQKVLSFFGFEYDNRTKDKKYWNLGYDFFTTNKGTTFEVKRSFNVQRKTIVIEEDHNIDPELGILKKGWFYTSKADKLCFMDTNKKKNKIALIFNFDQEFKQYYDNIKSRFKLRKNKPTEWHGFIRNVSTYRIIPISEIPNNFFVIVGFG
tara:strand:- start:609 stop:1127 length:519 start_codon:yes stop_codon:yes gene_type:complete